MSYFGMGATNPPETSISLEEAIAKLNIRKQNLDHIFGINLEAQIANEIREHELDRVLEILSRVHL